MQRLPNFNLNHIESSILGWGQFSSVILPSVAGASRHRSLRSPIRVLATHSGRGFLAGIEFSKIRRVQRCVVNRRNGRSISGKPSLPRRQVRAGPPCPGTLPKKSSNDRGPSSTGRIRPNARRPDRIRNTQAASSGIREPGLFLP